MRCAGDRAAMRMPAAPAVSTRQCGVFTRTQARAAGWSTYQVRRRIADGEWTTLLGRGLVVAGTSDSDDEAIGWATHLSAPGSVLSHLTAGSLLGFPLPAGGVPLGHVIGRSHDHVPGVRVHRAELRPDEVHPFRGLPMTSRTRTAIDCLAVLDHHDGARLWAWLTSRRVLTAPELGEAVRSRLGRQGTPALLRILTLARSGAASVGEALLHRVLHSAHLTGWTANATVRNSSGRILAVVDVLFAEARLVIEFDGFEAHRGRRAFVDDRRRQNALVNAGYRVLRVTWDDLTNRPGEIVAEIRRALKISTCA